MGVQFLVAVVGIALTAAPQVLGYGDPARGNDHIIGPLVATIGLTAAFQVTRPARWANLPLGLWLVLAPWVLGYPGWTESLVDTLGGLTVSALALIRGEVTEQYGGGWPLLWHGSGESR